MCMSRVGRTRGKRPIGSDCSDGRVKHRSIDRINFWGVDIISWKVAFESEYFSANLGGSRAMIFDCQGYIRVCIERCEVRCVGTPSCP